MGVVGVLRYPQGFGGWFGLIETIDHLSGYEGVAVAMDEEHGVCAVLDGIEGRSLAEMPAIA